MKAAYHQVCDDCARVALVRSVHTRQTTSVPCVCKHGTNLSPSLRRPQAAVPVAARQRTITLTLSIDFDSHCLSSLDDFD